MSGYTYKNVTSQQLEVVGYGVVAPGGEITSTGPIENPNLELINGEAASQPAEPAAAEATAQQPPTQPAAPIASVPVQKQEEAN